MKSNKLLVLVLASLTLGAACWANTVFDEMFPNDGNNWIVLNYKLFTVGESWHWKIWAPTLVNASLTLCVVSPSNLTNVPVCTANFASTDANGNWSAQGIFGTSEEGMWQKWFVLPDGTVTTHIYYAVYPAEGDTVATPPTPPPGVPRLITGGGFDPTLLAALQVALTAAWPTILEEEVPLFPPKTITVSPSTNGIDSTGCPDDMSIVSFDPALPKENGNWSAFFHEVEHALGCGYRLYGSLDNGALEESWATALQERLYAKLLKNGSSFFSAGTVLSVSQKSAERFGAANNLRPIIFGGMGVGVTNYNLPDNSAPWLALTFDAFASLGGSQKITQEAGLHQDLPLGKVLDLISAGTSVRVNGLPPGIFFGSNLIDFGALSSGTAVGLRESFMFAGSTLGSGYEVDFMSFSPYATPKGGTGDWQIDTGENTPVIASGTVTTDPKTGKGYAWFSDAAVLRSGNNLALGTGAYHFKLVMHGDNGKPSSDPLYADDDVFIVPSTGQTWSVGTMLVVANGVDNVFGNIASSCDLLTATQNVTISNYGLGMCLLTVSPNSDGTFPDVTLYREGSPIKATFTVPLTGATIVYFLAKPENAALESMMHLDGTTAKTVVPGEIVTLTGEMFSRNEPETSPQVTFPLPTEGCPGTSLVDQGRTQVRFTLASGTVLWGSILYCTPTTLDIVTPNELAAHIGETVTVAVIQNGAAPVLSQTFTVAAADPSILAVMDNGGSATVYATGESKTSAALQAMAKRKASTGNVTATTKLTVFATGLGPKVNPVTDGVLCSVANPTAKPVTATIGGLSAVVSYTGCAIGGYPGLDEVSLTVPAGQSGAQKLIVTVGGISSAAVTVTLH